jgi:hypothetical protein
MPPPPPVDRSFDHESVLFRTAGLDSSSLRADSEFDMVSGHLAAGKPVLETDDMLDQRQLISEIAYNTRVNNRHHEPQAPLATARAPFRFVFYVSDFLSEVVSLILEIISVIISTIIATISSTLQWYVACKRLPCSC